MDFSSYRLSSYLTSIICSSIVSTAVICAILSSPCFTTSSSYSSSSTSGSRSIYDTTSYSLSSQISQSKYHSTSSRHNYHYLRQQQERQKQQHGSLDCNPHHNSGSRSGGNSRRQRFSSAPLLPIYGSNDEDELRAVEQNYDVQRALFLNHGYGRQTQQRTRVMDLRSRSQRWIVDNLFRSRTLSISQDDIYGDSWNDDEEEEDEEEGDDETDEYEHEDYDYREALGQDNDDSELALEKDKESHTLDPILLPQAHSCSWIPQWTWITRKQQHPNNNNLQHPQQELRNCFHRRRHARLCRRRLYPKHDLDSQPHQHQPQQNPLSRQPISHKQLPWRRKTRTWRLDSMQHDPQRLQYQSHNRHHTKEHHNLHTISRHPGRRRSRNGRRTTTYSSSKSYSSVRTTFFNHIISSLFSSSPPPSQRHFLYTESKGKRNNNNSGSMDTLLYFLSDLPHGLSSLLHQDFASALFSTPPHSSSSSARVTPLQQKHDRSWFSIDYYLGGINNVHGPQRIPEHPLLTMAASNMLIRLGLLIVLCLGAFYYCVTTMEQQQRQIAGTDGSAGSNWLAETAPSSTTATTSTANSTTAASGGSNVSTTATEHHPRRPMSGLYPSTTTTTNGSSMSLGGSASGTITGGTGLLLTPNMTAAEVMASLGRSVNILEQLHHQQLQQLQQQRTVGGSLLNLTFVSGSGNAGPNSADSATTTPSTTPSSFIATIISALIRSTAMALTCGPNQLHPHFTPYSASTTPAFPSASVFSGAATEDKAGLEPEWKQDAEDLPLKKKYTPQGQDDTPTLPAYNKDKQKDLDSFNDDDEGVYQSEQEFGHFSPTGPTSMFDSAGEEDSWREYRNMMYYSTNYPPLYSTGGGGESSRSNSRRSSIFAPPPSTPVSTTAITHITTERSGERRECSRLVEEKEIKGPLWMHFYSLDALQSTICQRLFIASMTQQQHHQHDRQSQGCQFSRPMRLHKQPRTTSRKIRRQSRRITLSREVFTPRSCHSSSSSSSSPSISASLSDSVSSPSSTSISVSASSEQAERPASVSNTSRRSRVRTARRQSLSQ